MLYKVKKLCKEIICLLPVEGQPTKSVLAQTCMDIFFICSVSDNNFWNAFSSEITLGLLQTTSGPGPQFDKHWFMPSQCMRPKFWLCNREEHSVYCSHTILMHERWHQQTKLSQTSKGLEAAIKFECGWWLRQHRIWLWHYAEKIILCCLLHTTWSVVYPCSHADVTNEMLWHAKETGTWYEDSDLGLWNAFIMLKLSHYMPWRHLGGEEI
jgi:hypothetical protein